MAPQDGILEINLEDVIGDRFGRYSKYIIQDRALPDARDGLKPVQRRILYAMYQDGNTSDKPFRKSAKTVGNVIGNYHPHGDFSVYDAMVRMSQNWKLRNVLVEMHGNNGSIDGDPPAAMRYTEARLASIAQELLQDIEKNTVEFAPNFDDSIEEPVVLPARFPNLLVNGSTGISAGYATEIPPHQLGEVIDATIMQIENEHCSVDELLTVIKGPDFPTGGIIQGLDGIKKAYETGKGRIVIRGKATIESLKSGKEQIIITELPYEVNKANLVKKIDEIRLDKKVEGIVEIRDETDRDGLQIAVELKKDADSTGILNYLYKNTDLQVSYNFNMIAIHNKRPVLMNLKMMLQAYIDHQKEVVTRRTMFDLKKAKDRAHIVEGLIRALSVLDEVIATIRASKDKKNAKDNLITRFAFTEPQAEAIVSLQLYRLTNTDVQTLEAEAEELAKKIKTLEAILNSEKRLLTVIKKQLLDIKKIYNDERLTNIEKEIEEIKINVEVMIPQEDCIVTVTKEGYIKRTSPRSYAASNGEPCGMKETDVLLEEFHLQTTDTICLFTNAGNYLFIPVYELPDIRWKDVGQHIANIIPIERNEYIVAALSFEEFKENEYVTIVTKKGMIKKSQASLYKATRYSKPLVAIRLKEDGDEVVSVLKTSGNDEIFIGTHIGYGLRFHEEDVQPIGVRAAGVKAINLKENDVIIQAFVVTDTSEIVIVTQRGAVKRMKISEFERQNRAKRGLIMLRELKKNPHRIMFMQILLNDETHDETLHIVTEKGEEEIISLAHYHYSDRYSNGSFVVDEEVVGEVASAYIEVTPKS